MVSLREGKNTWSEMHADLAFPLWELFTSRGVPREIELNQKAAGGKESACQRRRRKIPGPGKFPEGGNGNPLHSCLENPMDGGAWWATVHGAAKSRTPLSAWALTAADLLK